MPRRTVTIDGVLFRELQGMRAKFIEEGVLDDMSLTTVVNAVLLGGLIATDKFSEGDWTLIRDFLFGRGPSLELDSMTDRRADAYLENLRGCDADGG